MFPPRIAAVAAKLVVVTPAVVAIAPPNINTEFVDCPEVGKLDFLVRSLIAMHSSGGQGMRLATLGPKMHQAYRVKISTYPEKNWRAYLTKRPNLYDVDPRGAEAMVRFRPAGFATVAPK